MATVITGKDLVQQNGVPQSVASAGQSGSGDLNIIKDIQQIMTQAKDIFSMLQQMRGTGQKSDIGGGLKTTAHNPPQSHKEESTKVVREKEYISQEIDKDKLYKFLYDLFVDKAAKLPPALQDMKLSDITGENFKTFEISFLGQKITHEKLLQMLTLKVSENLPKLMKDGATETKTNN